MGPAGFKWFGSLTNLSTRRQTEKAGVKVISEHHGIGTKAEDPGQPLDDMELCLRSPGYARSSDMYTHVGTVPRGERQTKSCRGLQERKKKKEEEEEAATGGLSKTRDHVRDSPLLSALSSLSLSSMEPPQPASARLLPPTAPTPGRASPLTSASDGSHEASRSQHASNTTSPQDVYVPMDPIVEAARSHVVPQSERPRGVTCALQEASRQEAGSAAR